MIYYILLLLFICILFFIFKKSKNTFLIISLLILLFMNIFRNPNLGLGDTVNVYLPLLDKVSDLSFNQIFEEYSMKNGIGYIILAKISSLVSNKNYIFFAFSTIPVLFAAFFCIKKYSKNYLLSMIIFVTTIYFFSFVAMRQFCAIGFTAMSFYYIKKRKPILFLLLLFISISIHFSSIVFLFAYVYRYCIKKGYFNIILILLAVLLSFFGKNYVLYIIKVFFPTYYKYITYGIYSIGTNFSLVWFLILSGFIILYYYIYHSKANVFVLDNKFVEDIDTTNHICFSIISLGIIVFCFSAVIVEFYRVSYYFTFFSILLIPNLLSKIKDRKLFYVVNLVIATLFITYFFFAFLRNTNCYNFSFKIN